MNGPHNTQKKNNNWAKLVTIVWCNQNLKNSSRPCGKIVLSIVKPHLFFSPLQIDSIYCLTLLIYFKEATVLARRELGQKKHVGSLNSTTTVAQLVEQASHVFVLVAVTQGSRPTCGPCCLSPRWAVLSIKPQRLENKQIKKRFAAMHYTKWAHIPGGLHY